MTMLLKMPVLPVHAEMLHLCVRLSENFLHREMVMQKGGVDKELLARIITEFFDPDVLRVDENIEGYHIDDQGRFILGCRAGPQVHVENLLHEMGHFADRSVKVLLQRPPSSWGYYLGQPWEVLGRSGREPTNSKPVYTEARCWAYQWSLIVYYEMGSDFEHLVDASRYLTAFSYFKGDVLSEEENNLDYRQSERLAVERLGQYILGLSRSTHCVNRFKDAWWTRVKCLKSLKTYDCV